MTPLIEFYYKQDKETQEYISLIYHDWIIYQNCCITNSFGVGYPHHLRCAGYCGISTKPPAIFEIPITHSLHNEIHTKGIKSFKKKYKINFIDILTKLHDEFNDIYNVY